MSLPIPSPSAALRHAAGLACLAALLIATPAARAADEEEAPAQGLAGDLHVQGMTFVGSRGEVSEFVLRAREALIHPDTNVAELEDVEVHGTENGAEGAFEVTCRRGEIDIDTKDFLAEGDVHGTAGNGRSYSAPWVRYDHAKELLYTDAPATMQDSTGLFSGDGFRYHLKDGRFRLTGNVKVVQQ